MAVTADPMPKMTYTRGPCPQCGATTEDEAGDRCTQTQDQTGEWSCAGEFDARGRSIVVSPESIKAVDDWCDREAKRQGW